MSGVKIKDVTNYLESIAPLSFQESYDNAGLLTGNSQDEVNGILVTLDCTEAVVNEAIQQGCNLIVAHHPIIFKGLKKITGSNYVSRTVIKAIKNDVAIYAIHTNLDNVHHGVNQKICEKIGLKNPKILSPKTDSLSKLVTFIPKEDTENVLAALHGTGAGQVGNYKNCSFQSDGTGSFKPDALAQPHIGQAGRQEYVNETRVELIFPSFLSQRIIEALRKNHPYEEVAFYVNTLSNENQEVGSGMIGEVDNHVEPLEFLKGLKISMDLKLIRYTSLLNKPVKRVAVCGGSGSFLLPEAIRAGADLFITSDFKYHEFFDADGRITVADIGHYESEVFTKELLQDVLMKKFSTFAIIFSRTVTNPISYL